MRHLDENAVAELMAGTLAPPEAEALQRHLDGCGDCRAFFAEVGRGQSLPGALDPTVPRAGAPDRLSKGEVVGRYVVSHVVGAGGMGVVYAAYDLDLDRRIALKLLAPERDTPELRSRLLREAQAMAQLSHPNVVAVHDVGTHHGSIFLAMEFVEGRTLARWLREAPRGVDEVIRVMTAAGEGLAAAHAAGLVHRDFKPENVLLGDDGRVRVTDFGLARSSGDAEVDAAAAASASPEPAAPAGTLTRTGALLGTPAYMAPEQHLQRPADARTDQFSFCVTLHEALYGERPFATSSLEVAREAVLEGRVREPAARRGVPARLRRLVLRGLSPEPEHRFESISALLRELRRVGTRDARRRLLISVAALALLGAGSAALVLQRAALCRGSGLRMAAVWNPATREQLSAAFQKTGKRYAVEGLPRVLSSIDAVTQAWVEQRTEACEATRVRGEQSAELLDLRMSCLERKLYEIEAVVAVLGAASDTTVENAAEAVPGTGTLAECADAAQLLASARRGLLPGTTPQEQALQRTRAEISARAAAGDYRSALDRSQQLGDGPPALRRSTTWAEMLLERWHLQRKLGDTRDAGLLAAIHAAEASGALQALVEGWLDLALLRAEGKAQGSASEALGHALALSERVPPSREFNHDSLSMQANVAMAQSDFARAEALNRKLLALKEADLGPTALSTGITLSNLGLTLIRQGRYDEAEPLVQRALEIKRAALGDEHPDLVPVLERLARLARAANRWEQALELTERTLRLRLDAYGPRHPMVAASKRDLGTVYMYLGRKKEALAAAREGLELQEALSPEDSSSKGVSLLDLAFVELDAGALQEAERSAARACAMLQKTLGESAGPYGSCLACQARILDAGGAGHRPARAGGARGGAGAGARGALQHHPPGG